MCCFLAADREAIPDGVCCAEVTEAISKRMSSVEYGGIEVQNRRRRKEGLGRGVLDL